jgi:Mg2+ and Co2+ transporter CorA
MNVHVPRTLDESYYPGLNDDQLSKRNDDQVLTRVAQSERKPEKLLVISQLWLWKMDDIIITAVPDSTWGEGRSEASLLVRRVNDAIFSITGTNMLKAIRPDLYLVWILSESIQVIERPHMGGFHEPIFYTFEKAVAIIFDNVQIYMTEEGMDNIQIDKEKEFMHQINDVREELTMIRSVIMQQEEVWTECWKDCIEDPTTWRGIDADLQSSLKKFLGRPNALLPKFRNRLDKIDQDAGRVERWILAQLDLKAKHASLKESHNSTTLSTAVIGFTVITIIFTPLSFLSSLFALPIDRLQRQQQSIGGTAFYTTNYIGTWMSMRNTRNTISR